MNEPMGSGMPSVGMNGRKNAEHSSSMQITHAQCVRDCVSLFYATARAASKGSEQQAACRSQDEWKHSPTEQGTTRVTPCVPSTTIARPWVAGEAQQ